MSQQQKHHQKHTYTHPMNPILFGLTLQTNHATDDKEIT
jgi:hypothetical protein